MELSLRRQQGSGIKQQVTMLMAKRKQLEIKKTLPLQFNKRFVKYLDDKGCGTLHHATRASVIYDIEIVEIVEMNTRRAFLLTKKPYSWHRGRGEYVVILKVKIYIIHDLFFFNN